MFKKIWHNDISKQGSSTCLCYSSLRLKIILGSCPIWKILSQYNLLGNIADGRTDASCVLGVAWEICGVSRDVDWDLAVCVWKDEQST